MQRSSSAGGQRFLTPVPAAPGAGAIEHKTSAGVDRRRRAQQ